MSALKSSSHPLGLVDIHELVQPRWLMSRNRSVLDHISALPPPFLALRLRCHPPCTLQLQHCEALATAALSSIQVLLSHAALVSRHPSFIFSHPFLFCFAFVRSTHFLPLIDHLHTLLPSFILSFLVSSLADLVGPHLPLNDNEKSVILPAVFHAGCSAHLIPFFFDLPLHSSPGPYNANLHLTSLS